MHREPNTNGDPQILSTSQKGRPQITRIALGGFATNASASTAHQPRMHGFASKTFCFDGETFLPAI